MDPRRHRLTEGLLPEAEVTFKTIDPVLPSPELEELRKDIQSLRDSIDLLDKRISSAILGLTDLRMDYTQLRGKFNWL